jgi:hypothetical protein
VADSLGNSQCLISLDKYLHHNHLLICKLHLQVWDNLLLRVCKLLLHKCLCRILVSLDLDNLVLILRVPFLR